MVTDGDGIRQLIDAHFEWLLVPEDGLSFPLDRTEIDISDGGEKVLFGFLDDRGYHSWRLNSYSKAENEILLDLAGAFGRARTRMRLIPRTAARELAVEIEIARLKRANEIALALGESEICDRINRVELAKDNARLAHIFFTAGGADRAALADLTDTVTTESLLSTALLWQERLASRKRSPVDVVWIIAEKKRARNLQALAALLTRGRRAGIRIAEIASMPGGETRINELKEKRISDLWCARSKKLIIPQDPQPGGPAREMTAMSPGEIDVIYSKQGETLRFMGLPFARARKTFNVEKAWFGIDRKRRPLSDESRPELKRLLADLRQYRCANTANKRHELFRLAPEAWLESILRRNIKLLDPNIILSPIYNQFRSSNDRIDLLALRKDGRLIIIELKTSPDREMVFQAVDYWRKIELQRRQGRLQEADLFEGREIVDKPALIYLVAPAWSFHADFGRFARMITPEVELWRFELHENWRDSVKVVARRSYSDPLSEFTNL